jgi:hypothetical protein
MKVTEAATADYFSADRTGCVPAASHVDQPWRPRRAQARRCPRRGRRGDHIRLPDAHELDAGQAKDAREYESEKVLRIVVRGAGELNLSTQPTADTPRSSTNRRRASARVQRLAVGAGFPSQAER